MLESDLWSQKWHAKSWVYWFDNCLNQHNFLHHFAKPLLASHYTNQLQAWRQILETATIAYSLSLVFQGLQPEVQQSTDCPTGSRALWSQTWLRKIDARNCVDIITYRTNRLASQSFWARRANCGLWHYCLEPFIWQVRLLRLITWKTVQSLQKFDTRN